MLAEFYGGCFDGMRLGVEAERETILVPEKSDVSVECTDSHSSVHLAMIRHIVYRRFCVLPDRVVYLSIDCPTVRVLWISSGRMDACLAYSAWIEWRRESFILNSIQGELDAISKEIGGKFEAMLKRKTLARNKKRKKV